MLGFLDAVRTLILYRNQLMDEYKATAYTDYNIQIYTVNALIGTLKFKVADFMNSQPKLNKVVLYLYYLKANSWEKTMNLVGLDESDGKTLMKKIFQVCSEWDETHFQIK